MTKLKKGVCESLQFAAGSDGGLTLETSVLKFLAVANLHYQLTWSYKIILLHSPTNAAPKFL